MRTAKALLCAVILAIVASPRGVGAEPKSSVTAQVGQLFEQAQAAFAKGDKKGAYDAYKAAWALQKSYDIAANLGVVELKLGKHRDAAEHLAYSLDNFPPTGEEAHQKATEKKLAEAVKEIGRLHVQVSVPGASVTVNGAPAGAAPIAATIFVEPGSTVVEAKLAGYIDARKQLALNKGGEETVSLTLVPLPPARRSIVPGAVMGGLAGAALVTGVVLEVVAANKRSSVETTSAAILDARRSCITSAANYDARCADLTDSAHGSDRLHDAGIGVLVGAGVLAAGTVAYLLWPAPAQGRVGGLLPAPIITATGAGLSLSGSF